MYFQNAYNCLLCVFVLINSHIAIATIREPDDVKGFVAGSVPCGSIPGNGQGDTTVTGTFIRLDIMNCYDAPCSFYPESTYEVAITMRPAATTNSLIYKLIFQDGADHYVVDKQMPGSFEKNVQYTVAAGALIPGDWAGKTGVLYVLLEDPAPHAIMCRQVDYRIG